MKILSMPKRKKERGAAIIEFALVLILFLMLVFGIMEFGWFFFVQHTLQMATREGMRRGAVAGWVSPTDFTSVITRAMGSTAVSISVDNVSSLDPDPTRLGACIRLRTEYTYKPLTFVGSVLPDKIRAEIMYKNEK